MAFQMEATPDGARRFLSVSSSCEALNGVTAEAAMADARVLYDLILPEYGPMMAEAERQALETLTPFLVEVPFRRPDGEVRWHQLSSIPRGQPDGSILWDGLQIDITERRQVSQRMELALAATGSGLWEYEIDNGRLYWSPRTRELYGVGPDEPIDFERYQQGVHPEDRGLVNEGYGKALAAGGGDFTFEHRTLAPDGQIRWVLAHGRVVAENGVPVRVIGATQDVTEQRRARDSLSESQSRLALAATAANLGIWDWDLLTNAMIYSDQAKAICGFDLDKPVTFDMARAVTHPDDFPFTMAQAQRALDPAVKEDSVFEYRIARPDGQLRWVLAHGEAVFQMIDGVETAVRFVGAIQDITDRKLAEQALRDSDAALREQQVLLEEETRALGILNRAGAAIASELDLDVLVQTVTDAGVELTGAQFGAFFYNVIDKAGESYMLYALSGVPREAFSQFPMPRNTAIFAPTFEGRGIMRSDDITAHPDYGRNTPRQGMPEGHLPVRSYLAVPVKSRSGEVLGGLFFGHAETGQFDERSERAMEGLAGQAAVAIDNARLFQSAQRELQQRRDAEARLHELNASLEQRVAEEVAFRAKAEEALRQAQKMEAIGQLTGGVAHDFNNLLTVILGGLDTIRRSEPDNVARIQRAADIAHQGAERAAVLTSRLLAFSRRQPLEPRAADCNVLVRDMTEMLHRTLGETIELEGVLFPQLWTVEVDPHQLESAILNLAVNARDAMPEGGKLTIETANADIDSSYSAADAEVLPGQYVVIAVSDTGTGMSPDMQARAFEPFFTTKDVGKGTGLGLSMVYGFVKQSGGHVALYSEEGQGTTVKLYFPRFRGEVPATRAEPARAAPAGGKDEVILVVEDNDDVRRYSTMILTELGYGVLEAADADEALRILSEGGRIDLMFTDVVLPGRSGRVLADLARETRPDLPVLFTTGYSRNAIVHHGRLDAGVQLLGKPFTYEQLAQRVRTMLDRR